jgi:hypothetical protein
VLTALASAIPRLFRNAGVRYGLQGAGRHELVGSTRAELLGEGDGDTGCPSLVVNRQEVVEPGTLMSPNASDSRKRRPPSHSRESRLRSWLRGCAAARPRGSPPRQFCGGLYEVARVASRRLAEEQCRSVPLLLEHATEMRERQERAEAQRVATWSRWPTSSPAWCCTRLSAPVVRSSVPT